jgi:hypothetical protein
MSTDFPSGLQEIMKGPNLKKKSRIRCLKIEWLVSHSFLSKMLPDFLWKGLLG